MATDSIQVSAVIPASPEDIYAAWLDSEAHSKMTGGAATIEPSVGGRHSAWDGYISGETLELEAGRRIVQAWRTAEFPDGSAHSRLVVTLTAEDGQTRVHIEHTEIPEGQGERYLKGWDEFYFSPMAAYFGARTATVEAPAKKGAARKTAKKGAKKAAAKKGAATKKTAAKKAAKKAAPKKAAAKKATAKKGAAKKGAAKKAAPKKTAKKATAKKASRG